MALRAALAILLALAAPAFAGPEEEAAEHYAQGTKQFNLAHYDEAIAEFDAAYNLKDDPRFIYNIAQAHRLAGHLEKAITFYRTFLRLAPASPLREAIEQQRLPELEKALAAQRAVAPPEPPRPAPEPVPPAPAAPAAPAATPAPHQPPRMKLAAPLVVGALALLSAGAGLFLYGTAAADFNATAPGCTPACDPQVIGPMATRAYAGYALLAMGGVEAVVDVVLWIVYRRAQREAPAPGITLRPGPGALKVSW
jgi:tetratricopeptide (TPR) repeat protein